MKSSKTYSSTGIGLVDRAFSEVYKNINELFNSVNAAQVSVGYGATGKSGDIRFVEGDDKLAYIEMKGDKGWYSSFAGVMVEKPAIGRPYPHFPYLEVDNLFAKIFTVNQTTSSNGNMIMSDYGIVESFSYNTITFKDQTNLNLCAFKVNDTCEVRSIKADKSLDIKKINFTITAVSGRTVTVTYSGTDKVAIGDVVIRKGNTTDATRQNAIYFSTSDTNSPYIDFYSGTTGYTFGAPIVRLGKLNGVTDTDFGGALTGNGLYCMNVYLKGKLKIATNADIIGLSANVTITAITAPTTRTDGTALVIGDLWIDTDSLNYRYRWDGSAWVDMNIPYVSTPTGSGLFIDGTHMGYYTAGAWQTYIDNAGKFYFKGNATNYISWDGTDFIVRGKITADDIYTGSLTALVERSSATMTYDRGIAGTEAGYWLGKYGLNDYRFFIGSSATKYFSYNNTDLTMVGGIITGGTIQTATSGQRIVMAGATNDLKFYNTSGLEIVKIGNNVGGGQNGISVLDGEIYVSGSLPSDFPMIEGRSLGTGINNYAFYAYAVNGTNNYSFYGSRGILHNYGNVEFGSIQQFTINDSGQLTKVNNIAPTAKYTLIGDGTSFTPRLLAMSDLPALTANRVLLSDASGYVSASGVTNTTLSYLDATSSVQTQLNGKGGLAAANTWTGENSFTKFKLGAEVSHSVTATGNYDCLDKNVIILTPTAAGYTATLTNLSNNRPVFVINASATYSVTVNGTVQRLLGVNEATWIMYNSTSNKTYITN